MLIESIDNSNTGIHFAQRDRVKTSLALCFDEPESTNWQTIISQFLGPVAQSLKVINAEKEKMEEEEEQTILSYRKKVKITKIWKTPTSQKAEA